MTPLHPASPGLDPSDLFHVGIVVDDLEAAMRDWSTTLGIKWREPFAGVTEVRAVTSTRLLPIQAVYSVDGPVHLELIPRSPGTCWDGSGLHHLGYWSADVAADRDLLVRRGGVIEATMVRDGRAVAAYLWVDRSRVELVDVASKQRLVGAL